MFTPKYPTPDTLPTAATSLVRPLTGLVHPPLEECSTPVHESTRHEKESS